MGKIRVHDLAEKMGVAEQDLLFKLKSIGVRVEGEEALIDTEIIQAILQGKKLPQPQREVILRDEPAAVQAPRRRVPSRRMPPPNLRPPRRRAVVHKAEPKIKTLPATEAPKPPAEATPAAAGSRAPAAAASSQPLPARETQEAPREVEAPVRVEAAPKVTAPAPVSPPAPKREKEKKRRRVVAPEKEDLRAYTGSVQEIEEREEEAVTEPAGRRRRRAQRKKEQEEAAEQGKVLTFKKPEDEGPVTIAEGMRIRDLAEKLGLKTKDLMRTLIGRGIMAGVNHVLDPELAKEIAEELGFEAMVVSFEEEVQLQQEPKDTEVSGGTEPRAPVVTIMGHVDHGKTTLLDVIRSSRVTESEFGGITQHIGAYQVAVNDRKVVLLDTPGHEAFTKLRARGANVTDIVILVVAADDGVMPQTIEAIDHAKAAGVPIIVAINKVDKENANLDRVKKELSERQVLVEDWGGDTVAVPVSALKKQGIDELLEMVALTADLLDLKASSELPAQGAVLEARKEPGRGIVATVLVQDGTLRVGESFVSGSTWGRVRSMVNDLGERVDEAPPATPVEVSGFSDLPQAGDAFQVVAEENKARSIAEFRREEQRQRELAPTHGRLSLESLFDQISKGEVKELPIVLKADAQGSVEVLTDTLEKLSTDKVRIRVIRAGVGAITTHDVDLASASGAIVYGFNVRPERNATEIAEKEEVEIRTHTVIYELNAELRDAMAGLLEPTYREVDRGRAEVREIFKVPKIGVVAGCHVIEGSIPRDSKVRLLRDNVVVHEGKIASLRRFKDDAAEVRSGFDCGIGLDRFQDFKPGDVIEAYVREAVAPTL